MKQESDWNFFEEEVNRRGFDGAKATIAMREYYSVFDESVLEWLGKLYSHDIGGFYFSNSARDNEYVVTEEGKFRLLPDIESTYQALRFLTSSGTIKRYSELPGTMCNKIKEFLCSLESEENGFFYHPQWTHEMVDSKPARRGRDIRWAILISEMLSFKFPYPTAVERLASCKDQEKSDNKIPDYLYDRERFLTYLKSFDWDNEAYYAGNALSAQSTLINASGLTDVAVEFLNRIQNTENGLWGTQGGYTAVNAYLKLSNFYTSYGKVIPNADKAFETVLECAASDEAVNTVCWQYNVWSSLDNIIKNLRAAKTEDGIETADKLLNSLYASLTDVINSTRKKALAFKKDDSSFSFNPNRNPQISQGLPVTIKERNEGCVNATLLCSAATVQNVFRALDLGKYQIPLFGKNAFEAFISSCKIN